MANVVRDWRTIPIVAGGTITFGVAGLLVLMSARAGTWSDHLEMVWSLLLGGVLGWLPVRNEQRTTSSTTTSIRDWRRTVATASFTWLLLWWLLSFGLLIAYQSNSLFESQPVIPAFLRLEVLPWSLLAFCSARLVARLCSARWLTWPLFVLALGVGWCAWWLLAMLGEPAWAGVLIIAALFAVASAWHARVTQRGQPIWRTNLSAVGGPVCIVLLLWGLLNWWRVAAIPNDWTGGAQPNALPAPSAAGARELALERAEFNALVAQTRPAPSVRWTDGREVSSFNNDWGIIDGNKPWSDVTEITRQWVEQNADVINARLSWNPSSRTSTVDERLNGAEPVAFELPRTPSKTEQQQTHLLWVLAARRCEHEGQLDEAWRLHRLGFLMYRQTALSSDEGRYFNVLLHQFWHYERLAVWVWHPQQTSMRLKQAIAEVLADRENALPPEVVIPYEFQGFREAHARQADTDRNTLGDWSWERWLFRRLCPAETQRERQMIDGLEAAHQVAFADLRPLTRDLSATWTQPAHDDTLPVSVARPKWLIPSRPKLITKGTGTGLPWIRGRAAELMDKTPRLNAPKFSSSSSQDWEAVRRFLSTEGQRRALLLFMAERAFELDHHRPPNSSDELVPAYLPQRPVTVISGVDLLIHSRRPRVAPRSISNAPANAQPIREENPAMLAFRRLWPTGPTQIHLEISLKTPPHLIFFAP